MDWLSDTARWLRDTELGNIAGIVNIACLFAMLRLSTSVSFAERAMDRLLVFAEGRRKYRAAMAGRKYTPVFKYVRPAPQRLDRLKAFATSVGFLLICALVITVVTRVSD